MFWGYVTHLYRCTVRLLTSHVCRLVADYYTPIIINHVSFHVAPGLRDTFRFDSDPHGAVETG
jgi:hypothetical protein